MYGHSHLLELLQVWFQLITLLYPELKQGWQNKEENSFIFPAYKRMPA